MGIETLPVETISGSEEQPKKKKKVKSPVVIDRSFFASAESVDARQEAKFEEKKKNIEVESFINLKHKLDEFDDTVDFGDPIKNEIAASIKTDFQDLIKSAIQYVQARDKFVQYSKDHGREVDIESKNTLERVDQECRFAHNIVIGNLNSMSFYLAKLGIDNNLISAIVSMDRKLDTENSADRRGVERWARNIAEYLATLSETTP